MTRDAWKHLLLTIALVACATSVGAQSSRGLFKVEQPRIDLGEIKAGTEAEATFVFHNDGTEDVKILRAKPS